MQNKIKILILIISLIGLACFTQARNKRSKIFFSSEEKKWIKAHPQVVVGFDPSWAPFEYADTKGEQKGISSEVLKFISDYTGLKFISITGKWDDIVNKFEKDKIDMLSAVVYNPKRKEYGIYTSPYYTIENFIFVKQSNKDIRSFSDLYGKTVALPKDYAMTLKIKEKFPQIKILETNNILDSILAVINGHADATIESQAIVNYTMQKNSIGGIKGLLQTKLKDSELCMLVRNDLPILRSIIQKALDVVLRKDIVAIKQKFFIYSTVDRTQLVRLTDAEEEWIKKHSVIRFTGDPNWLPYEAFNKDGEYIGIVAEYLKLIEKRLNITFKKIPSKTWEDAVEMARTGKVDIISANVDSELNNYLIFTNSYLHNPIVIIMDNRCSYIEHLDQIKDKKIALIKGYGYVSKIEKKYDDISFLEVNNIQEGLMQVSTGKIDAFLCSMALGAYSISEMGLNNIKMVGKTEFSTELGLGVRKRYAPLVPILNKAIASITQKERQKIAENWIKYKYVEKVDYTLLWQISGFLVLIIFFTLFWTQKLSKAKNEIKRKEIFLKTVLNTQTQLIFTTDIHAEVMLTANKAFFDMFGFKDVNDFQQHYKCICDIFDSTVDPEEYLLKSMPGGLSWIEYMKQNPDKYHKVVINWKENRWTFSVTFGDLSYLDEKMCLVVLNDITDMEEAIRQLHAQKEKHKSISKQLSKYLSPQIYDMIFYGKQDMKISSKRKKLTIFFSDIVGFTTLTENLESEELTELLNNYMTEMAKIALKHGATIDKYIGDAIVIFFGDPESRGYKQDALSCIQMAVEMQDKNRKIRAKLVDEGIVSDFQMRIGIHTAYCTVGNFGSNARMDYTIIGGGVNLASRLETNAPPGGILISHETYSLVKNRIKCQEKGELTVKGITKSVNTYQVIKEIKS